MRLFRRVFSLILITSMLFSLSCEAFASTLTLPAALEVIGDEAFYGDESLDEVVVPYGATTIGERAFAYSGLKRITIPDTVTEIAEDAFDGAEDVTIYSSDMSHAKWYADEYGLGWEGTDQYDQQEREEAISHISEIPAVIHNMSELEFTLEEIVPEDVNDQETLSLIDAYNESVRSLRNEVEALNSAIRSAKEACAELEALSENVVCDVSDSEYSVRLDDFSFSVRGDAYSALNGKCELLSSEVLEDGTVEYTVQSENGETFYLITSEDGLEASYQTHAPVPAEALSDALMFSAPGAEPNAAANPAWYESPVIGYYGTFSDSVSLIADGSELTAAASARAFDASATLFSKGVLTARQTSIVQNSAYTLSSASNSGIPSLCKYLSDTSNGIGKTMGAANAVATGYSAGNYINKLDDLHLIIAHDHPTEGEAKSDESYNLAMLMTKRIKQAVDGYSMLLSKAGTDAALTIVTWGESSLLVSSVNVLSAGSNLSLFGGIEEDAEEAYQAAVSMHDMLHYSVSGTVRDENTRQPLSGVSVDCEAAGHEVMHGTTDANGKYSFEPLSLNLKLTFKKAGYGEVVKNVPDENETLAPDAKNITRDAELSVSSWGTVTDALTGDPVQDVTVTLDGEMSTVTNEYGEFTFHYEGLHTHAHTFTLQADGYGSTKYQAHVGINTLPLAFTIRPFSKAYGEVTSEETGAALSGVKVTLTDTSMQTPSERVAYTDADGRYSFLSIPSTYTLSFSKEGFDSIAPIHFERAIVGYNLYDAKMPAKTYTLSGIVTDQRTGAGIAGATVTLDDGRTTTSGADGQYSFSKVAPGSHTISAVKTRYNITSVDVFVSNHDKYQKIILTSENIPKTEFNSAFWEWCVSQFDGTYDAEKDKIVYDGELSKEEAEAVTEIYCKENGFSSLQGIKYFVNLEILGCHHNNLTSLDVSGLKKLNRIICNNNQLQSVDLSGCTALSVFECEVNQLTRLDLSGYKELTKVSIYNNPLTDLNLAGCTSLSKLYVDGGVLNNLNVSNCINLESLCCHHNYLTSLNLSGCRKLKTIICNNNQLTSIDVSDCPLLETFEFEENLVQSLDLSGHSALNNLGCSNNPLERLNLSNCSSLPVLHISSAQLTSLVLSGCSALTELVCPNNKLTSLDVSDCPKLEMLICFNNKLTNLDVSGCTALTELACFNNTLTALDVSDCSSLSSLACNANRLTALDVSHNKALTKLGCLQNRLTSLDVSGLTTLTELICYENQLTSLNVSGCAALQILNAHTNQLPTLDVSECAAMTKLVCAGNKLTSLDLTGCEALTELVCQGNPLTSLVCVGNKLTNLDLSGCTTLTELVCQENPMTSLNLSGCVALTKVLCQNNELASLDVSGLTALAELICYENQITSLNVTGCTALERLNAHTNQLTSLDVSGFTALTKLVCAGNQLTSLDLSGCFALTELACQANNLTSLNVSGCKALQKLECMNNQLTRINVADCEALTDANITCDSGVTIIR